MATQYIWPILGRECYEKGVHIKTGFCTDTIVNWSNDFTFNANGFDTIWLLFYVNFANAFNFVWHRAIFVVTGLL